MKKILIVEDHPIVVEGLQKLIEEKMNSHSCKIANTGEECMSAIHKSLPDIILMDINLPDISGIELCKKVKQRFPEIKILALSSFKEKSYIQKMVESGASGYVLKNANPDEIIVGIQSVLDGNNYFDDEAEKILAEQDNANEILLTRREKEVLNMIAEGYTNNEIADKLFISVSTVDSHRKNMLMKMDVKNTAALIKKCALLKLIDF